MATTTSDVAINLQNHIDLQSGEGLYALVDAAQDDGKLAFEIRDKCSQRIRMLFQGEAAQYMKEVAPYFVQINANSEFLKLWAENWGTNAGILLTSAADPQKVFRHLREIFVVKDESGQEFFFRFYDPRVLRVFLPTCTVADLRVFFGSINRLFASGNAPGTLLRFGRSSEGLIQSNINLLASVPPKLA